MMREGWAMKKLGDVCRFIGGGTPSKSEPTYWNGGIPWASIKDMKGDILNSTQDEISEIGLKNSASSLAMPGEIILATRINPGRPIITKIKVSINQDLKVVKPKTEISVEYLYFALRNVEPEIRKISSGTTVLGINLNNLNEIPIPLPPHHEQKAIVAKIEQLFSELDNGIANLQEARRKIDIYRQSVLKKAFEGELTKDWRSQQPNLPTGEELLNQILAERQRHYEQQLADWKSAVKSWEENGKKGRKPGRPSPLSETSDFPVNVKTNLPSIPNEWCWVKLGSIHNVYVGATPKRNHAEFWNEGEIAWVSSGEVMWNRIKKTKERITVVGLNNTSTTLHPAGTVMLAMIGEGKTRGQAAILDISACHNQNTAAIGLSGNGHAPEYLFYYLLFKYEVNRRVGSGNNQKALNKTRIMDFDFPICSIMEQTQIVQEIESRLSVCDKLTETIDTSLKQAEALRQWILKKAFDGKLT